MIINQIYLFKPTDFTFTRRRPNHSGNWHKPNQVVWQRVRQGYKVLIPTNADQLTDLINLIVAKEDELGADGMLKPEELQQLKDMRDEAHAANEDKKALEKLAEEKTRQRNNALGISKDQLVTTPGTALFLVTKVRDKALAENKTNKKALGGWGFVVDDSAKGGKAPGAPSS